MKLIGIMSQEVNQEQIRNLFQKHQVHLYSETEIVGHSAETIEQFGWWHQEPDLPVYTTLYFAIISAEKAEELLEEAKALKENSDILYPPRAFLIDVEQMV